MAIAGGATSAYELKIEDGELHATPMTLLTSTCDTPEDAIALLHGGRSTIVAGGDVDAVRTVIKAGILRQEGPMGIADFFARVNGERAELQGLRKTQAHSAQVITSDYGVEMARPPGDLSLLGRNEMAARYDAAAGALIEALRTLAEATAEAANLRMERDLAIAAWVASGDAEKAASLAAGTGVKVTESLRSNVVEHKFEVMRRRLQAAEDRRGKCLIEAHRTEAARWALLLRVYHADSEGSL